MSYEKIVEHNGQCPCGKGTIEYICYSPDFAHGKCRYESHMHCEICSLKYYVKHDHKMVWLESKQEHEEKLKLSGSLRGKHEQLKAIYMTPLASKLEYLAKEKGRKISDWYICLSEFFDLGLEHDFRKSVKGAGNINQWLVNNITLSNVSDLYYRFNDEGASLDTLLEEYLFANEKYYEYKINKIKVP